MDEVSSEEIVKKDNWWNGCEYSRWEFSGWEFSGGDFSGVGVWWVGIFPGGGVFLEPKAISYPFLITFLIQLKKC